MRGRQRILWKELSSFWRVTRKRGSALDDGIWFLPMAPIRGAQVALYYTFDDSTVTLLAIASV